MRASLRGREELAVRVQQALALPTKKEAEQVVDAVIGSLEATLLNNLATDGFTLKLGSFGKFSVPPQGWDSQEDSVHGTDDPDNGQAEGQVCQFGGVAAM